MRGTARHVILKASGRCDDDIGAALERIYLRRESDAAVDGRDADLRVLRERREMLRDLIGQLARRREDECARLAARLIQQRGEQRQAEGGGLSASRLGACEDVAPFETGRNSEYLDRSGFGKLEIVHATQKRRRQAELFKGRNVLTIFHESARLDRQRKIAQGVSLLSHGDGAGVKSRGGGVAKLTGFPFAEAAVAHDERFAAVDLRIEVGVVCFCRRPIDVRFLPCGGARLYVGELRTFRQLVERFDELLCVAHGTSVSRSSAATSTAARE